MVDVESLCNNRMNGLFIFFMADAGTADTMLGATLSPLFISVLYEKRRCLVSQVAQKWPLIYYLFSTYSTLHCSEVLKSVSLLIHISSLIYTPCGKCHRVLKSVNVVYTSLYIRPIKEVEYQCALFLPFLSTWDVTLY